MPGQPLLRILEADSRSVMIEMGGQRLAVVPSTPDDITPMRRVIHDQTGEIVAPEEVSIGGDFVLRRLPTGSDIPEEYKQVAAYYDWKARGCPVGDDQQDYFDAERELKKGVVIAVAKHSKEAAEVSPERVIVSPFAGAVGLLYAALDRGMEILRFFKFRDHLNGRTTSS